MACAFSKSALLQQQSGDSKCAGSPLSVTKAGHQRPRGQLHAWHLRCRLEAALRSQEGKFASMQQQLADSERARRAVETQSRQASMASPGEDDNGLYMSPRRRGERIRFIPPTGVL